MKTLIFYGASDDLLELEGEKAIFIDGRCPDCGSHIYNRNGNAPFCHRCGWKSDPQKWEEDMLRVMDAIGRMIDTYQKAEEEHGEDE